MTVWGQVRLGLFSLLVLGGCGSELASTSNSDDTFGYSWEWEEPQSQTQNDFLCHNGGSGMRTATGFFCHCPRGYDGDQCQSSTKPEQPKLNASLGEDCFDWMDKTWCGTVITESVDVNHDVCLTDPCLHFGTCWHPKEYSTTVYRCSCRPPWGGKDCRYEDKCFSGRYCNAENSVNCTLNSIESQIYTCKCKEGFTGEQCESELDVCASNPCNRNNATCRRSDDRLAYECVCPTDYVGSHCQWLDNCRSGPCKNNGSCISEDLGWYHCECAAGFTGERCQFNKWECVSDPCGEHAECVDEVNGYHCDCKAGHYGDHCENEDMCYKPPKPCQNDGTCINVNSTDDEGIMKREYKCICGEGSVGDHCEVLVACIDNKCQHGSTCKPAAAASKHETVGGEEEESPPPLPYSCQCPTDYYGEMCESKVKYCDSKPCQNGGTCAEWSDTYHCTCEKGFLGYRCETPPAPPPKPKPADKHKPSPEKLKTKTKEMSPRLMLIIFGVVGGLAILMGIIGLVLYKIWRSTRQPAIQMNAWRIKRRRG